MEKYNNELIPPPFGLLNNGAICYFNSFLQTLCGCSAFTTKVLENSEYMSKTRTGVAIYQYVCMYTSNPISTNIATATINILRALVIDLRERRPSIRFGNGQESAHEVFILLLDMMEPQEESSPESNIISSIKSPITKLFLHKCEWNTYCMQCKKSISKKIDYGVIFDMHHIDFIKGSNGDSQEYNHNSPIGFSNLIKNHISQLEGYNCPSCNADSVCRIYSLKRIPEIVFCSFNIYYQYGRKIRYFPPYLEFETGNDEGKYFFKLIGQIEHSGSLNGGHYWAKGLRQDDKVYDLNDMGFALSSFQSTPHTYMVIYHIQ
jgi:ubiquitin C-terminal hydrolase